MADTHQIERLRYLAGLPIAELRARANALPELLQVLGVVLKNLPMPTPSRESTPALVATAQRIMQTKPMDLSADRMPVEEFNSLLVSAKSLAGSVISQADPRDNKRDLPLDEGATRALRDAQEHGQAAPLERTVVIGPDSTGPKEPEDNA